jgi:hypothetical protein
LSLAENILRRSPAAEIRSVIDLDGYADVHSRERIPLLIGWRNIANALTESPISHGESLSRLISWILRSGRLTGQPETAHLQNGTLLAKGPMMS